MQTWASDELSSICMPDARLKKRLIGLVETLAARPRASLAQACGSWSATKAAYRFLASERVQTRAVQRAHQQSILGRIGSARKVLAVQDTTDLDFTTRPKTQGLGLLSPPTHTGLLVHSVFCVSPDGLPLGVLEQKVWARAPEQRGKKHQRHQLATKDKESQRWLDALKATEKALPEQVSVVTIADREADLYDLFAMPRRPNSHLLIRAVHDRQVHVQGAQEDTEAGKLWERVRQEAVVGQFTFRLQRADGRPAREVTLSVRFASVQIQPPKQRRRKEALRPIVLQAILAEEEQAPTGSEPLSWLLLTSLPVSTLWEAQECLRWYGYRWLIERYHFVLKSGCRLQALQLHTAERIKRALCVYSLVAWRLLWLTYEARQHPDSCCERVLQTHEWQALYACVHRTQEVPTTPPTLQQVVRWIAQLGGFLARKSDQDPGVQTLWQGCMRLHDIADTWLLLRSPATYG